jgi:single-strand DNA-binding protein
MSLNKVILIGNVGKDPDVHYFDSKSANAKFTLATSERGYTLANGTQVPEKTEWHNIVARRNQAQFVEKYVKKGSSLLVEGKLTYRDYTDNTGVKRYVTEIIADRIEFYNSGRPQGQDATANESGTAPETVEEVKDPAQLIPTPDASEKANPEDLPF